MVFKLKHNTLMRLTTGLVLVVALPGLLFLILWPLAGVRIALSAAVALILVVAYGFFFGWRHIVVRKCTCTSSMLPPEKDGYRILQISDIHIGTYLRNRHFVDRLVAKANAQGADLIVFTGDLVNVSAEELIPFRHTLSQLHAPDGVFSIMGNHDYCEYMADKSEHNIDRNQHALRYLESKMGWHILLNEHVLLPGGMALIGVENSSRPPFPDYGDLKKAMTGLSDGMFKILLTHDPSHWRREVLRHTDIALTLSGHTHAGQLRIWRFSPAKWAYSEWGGKYTESGQMLHVSQGVGGTVPFRIGAWPEINVIELKYKPLSI